MDEEVEHNKKSYAGEIFVDNKDEGNEDTHNMMKCVFDGDDVFF